MLLNSAAVSLRNAACGYSAPILQDVTIDLEPGTATLLIGPNGGGKSTLLRSFLGETLLSADQANILGRPVTSLRGEKRCRTLAYAPQAESVLFPFTAVEYAALGRSVLSSGYFAPDEDVRIARGALEEIGAGHFAERPITELSGGETHLVVIARALAQQAPILLLDEPLAHLDVAHWKLVLDAAHRRVDAGATIVIALHDLNLAAMLGLPAFLVARGRVVPIDLKGDSGLDAIRGAYGVEMSRHCVNGLTYLSLTGLPWPDGPSPTLGTTTVRQSESR